VRNAVIVAQAKAVSFVAVGAQKSASCGFDANILRDCGGNLSIVTGSATVSAWPARQTFLAIVSNPLTSSACR